MLIVGFTGTVTSIKQVVTQHKLHAVHATQTAQPNSTTPPSPHPHPGWMGIAAICLRTCIECVKLLAVALLVPGSATKVFAAWAGSRVHGCALAGTEGTVGTLN
jgi:hypothetical protein